MSHPARPDPAPMPDATAPPDSQPTLQAPRGPSAPAAQEDVVTRAWGAVTVRVAWTLLMEGLAVTPGQVRDARDHVWFHLPAHTSTLVAADRAERLVQDFVARARGKSPTRPFAADDPMPLSRRWRTQLDVSLSPRSALVMMHHLANRRPLETLAERYQIPRIALEAAREGLRERLRRAAAEDGVPLDGWKDDRLDALLHRIASMPMQSSPPLLEVADGLHPDAPRRCVRAYRVAHLVARGLLARRDLIPPSQQARPTDTASVLALHIHPDGRQHQRTLAMELPGPVMVVGTDTLLLDGARRDAIWPVLELAAQVALPDRDHLRGALVEGPGRWSRHGLLGPLADEVLAEVRAEPWGTVADLGELPPPLPEPPSARGMWLLAILLLVSLVPLSQYAFRADPPRVDHPLEATATEGRAGVWIHFDVDEEAYVHIVRQRGEQLDLLLHSSHIADKVDHATGDGTYRLHTRGRAVLVASAPGPLPHLADMIASASQQTDPLDALADAIRDEHPTTDVWVHPP